MMATPSAYMHIMVSSHLRGILSMAAAIAAFSLMDLAMKQLVGTYPAMQVTYLRAAASLPLLLAFTAIFGQWRDMLPTRWALHLLRGALGVAMLWAFVQSVRFLSLADAYSIYMSAPLLITALSMPFLGEHVGWRRWTAVVVGMLAVILILQPTGTSVVTTGGLLALASAFLYAVSAITIRILSRTDSAAATVIWAIATIAILGGVLSIPGWVPLQPEHWTWIACLGLSGAVGQHFITAAFRCAPASVIAPLEYTALLWGMGFDWLFWSTTPSARMLTGASIIVASGLYVIYREAQGKD